jgi:hypothetical protein
MKVANAKSGPGRRLQVGVAHATELMNVTRMTSRLALQEARDGQRGEKTMIPR